MKKIILQHKKFVLLLALAFLYSFPQNALASGYYEVDDNNRPHSAFSLCCCKQERQSEKEIIKHCTVVDEREYDGVCPDNFEEHAGGAVNCPYYITITKYNK